MHPPDRPSLPLFLRGLLVPRCGMIVGHVRAGLDSVVRLIVVGRGGRSEEFEALVDTGFNGSLSLPSALTARLALPVTNTADGRLADGKMISVNSYRPTL